MRELPTYRPGRELLIKRDDLHRWIEAHPVRPTEPTPADDAAAAHEAEVVSILDSLAKPRRKAGAR